MARKTKPLEEGDAIGSVLDGRRLVRVKRAADRGTRGVGPYACTIAAEGRAKPEGLAFVGRCGLPYFRDSIETMSRSLNHHLEDGDPGTIHDAECLAQQLLAEGLVDGPGWETPLPERA